MTHDTIHPGSELGCYPEALEGRIPQKVSKPAHINLQLGIIHADSEFLPSLSLFVMYSTDQYQHCANLHLGKLNINMKKSPCATDQQGHIKHHNNAQSGHSWVNLAAVCTM